MEKCHLQTDNDTVTDGQKYTQAFYTEIKVDKIQYFQECLVIYSDERIAIITLLFEMWPVIVFRDNNVPSREGEIDYLIINFQSSASISI